MSEHDPRRYCLGCAQPHSACTCGADDEQDDDEICAECESSPCLCEDLDQGNCECVVCGEEEECDCFENCDGCGELVCECICKQPPPFYGDEGEDLQ